jgi:hypothetical protein
VKVEKSVSSSSGERQRLYQGFGRAPPITERPLIQPFDVATRPERPLIQPFDVATRPVL